MNRRQFGAMLATATFSLGGVAGATTETAAQDTEPLQIEDVSVSLGGVTTNVGRAAFTFEDGTMQFEASDWTMESDERSLSIATARVTADDVSAETFATVRTAMVDSFQSQSLVPLLTGAVESGINPDAAVRLVAESVELDGQLVADRITATGTVASIVAEGTRDLLQADVTLEDVAGLGSSEWSQLAVQRGDAEVVANDVVMQLDGATASITSTGGEAVVSGRTFEFGEATMNVLPPETIPAAHVEFASLVRQSAADGDLGVTAVSSAADEAGVTVSNTTDAVESARFDLSLAEVTEGGETVIANFETSGTLSELATAIRQQT